MQNSDQSNHQPQSRAGHPWSPFWGNDVVSAGIAGDAELLRDLLAAIVPSTDPIYRESASKSGSPQQGGLTSPPEQTSLAPKESPTAASPVTVDGHPTRQECNLLTQPDEGSTTNASTTEYSSPPGDTTTRPSPFRDPGSASPSNKINKSKEELLALLNKERELQQDKKTSSGASSPAPSAVSVESNVSLNVSGAEDALKPTSLDQTPATLVPGKAIPAGHNQRSPLPETVPTGPSNKVLSIGEGQIVSAITVSSSAKPHADMDQKKLIPTGPSRVNPLIDSYRPGPNKRSLRSASPLTPSKRPALQSRISSSPPPQPTAHVRDLTRANQDLRQSVQTLRTRYENEKHNVKYYQDMLRSEKNASNSLRDRLGEARAEVSRKDTVIRELAREIGGLDGSRQSFAFKNNGGDSRSGRGVGTKRKASRSPSYRPYSRRETIDDEDVLSF